MSVNKNEQKKGINDKKYIPKKNPLKADFSFTYLPGLLTQIAALQQSCPPY